MNQVGLGNTLVLFYKNSAAQIYHSSQTVLKNTQIELFHFLFEEIHVM